MNRRVPASTIREGDVFVLEGEDHEYLASGPAEKSGEYLGLGPRYRIPVEDAMAQYVAGFASHDHVRLVRRTPRAKVAVTWTLTAHPGQTDPDMTTVRTDPIDLSYTRERGYDDIEGARRILATTFMGAIDYAPHIVILASKPQEG